MGPTARFLIVSAPKTADGAFCAKEICRQTLCSGVDCSKRVSRKRSTLGKPTMPEYLFSLVRSGQIAVC